MLLLNHMQLLYFIEAREKKKRIKKVPRFVRITDVKINVASLVFECFQLIKSDQFSVANDVPGLECSRLVFYVFCRSARTTWSLSRCGWPTRVASYTTSSSTAARSSSSRRIRPNRTNTVYGTSTSLNTGKYSVMSRSGSTRASSNSWSQRYMQW